MEGKFFFNNRKDENMANNSNLPSRSMKIRTKITMTVVFFNLLAFFWGNFLRIYLLINKEYNAKSNDPHIG